MKECLIHLGFRKTGTTSIQESLFENREYLRANGIYYPTFSINGETLGKFACHVLQAVTKDHEDIDPFWRLGRSPVDLRNFGISQLDAVIRGFRASGCSTLLISSELIGGNYFPQLCQILQTEVGPVRAVLYVRAPLPMFRSRFQQEIRGGKLLTRVVPQRKDTALYRKSCTAGISIRKYLERGTLATWDVVSDFWYDILSLPLPARAPGPILNGSESAEHTLFLAEILRGTPDLAADTRRFFMGWCRQQVDLT